MKIVKSKYEAHKLMIILSKKEIEHFGIEKRNINIIKEIKAYHDIPSSQEPEPHSLDA